MKELSRREAIKTFAFGAAFSSAAGRSWAAPVLYDLRPLAETWRGVLRIELADFPALAQPLGSVRVGTSPLVPVSGWGGVKHQGLFPPVLINRGEADDLYVVSAECMHEGCTVRTLNPQTRILECSCQPPPTHGSQYTIDGQVVRGPARQPLEKFDFQREGDVLLIAMPEMFYEVSAKAAGNSDRLELSFLGLEMLTYEVYFRDSAAGPAQRVPFSMTADGPLNQMELFVPMEQANFYSVFLEKPGRFGFFQIALKAQAV